jgi:hypothetical protein
MPAPKGHKMWGNPCKPKSYSPEELWTNACLYFEWVDANPWMMIEQSKQPQKLPTNYDKKLHGSIKNFLNQIVKLPHARPYTIEGLCIYLNISAKTFRNYSDVAGYETYFPICSHIKTVIDNQQFDGGMVGAFNANIVTRKLGLADKQELTGKDGKDLVTTMTFITDNSAKQTFASNERDVE